MWDSALSTDEFAAIRSVGFEPVGQVLGVAVYNVGFPGGESCPTYGSREDEGFASFARPSSYAGTPERGQGRRGHYGRRPDPPRFARGRA